MPYCTTWTAIDRASWLQLKKPAVRPCGEFPAISLSGFALTASRRAGCRLTPARPECRRARMMSQSGVRRDFNLVTHQVAHGAWCVCVGQYERLFPGERSCARRRAGFVFEQAVSEELPDQVGFDGVC